MRLLKQIANSSTLIEHLDLDLNKLSDAEITQRIRNFDPEVMVALSDDENESVLKLSTQHFCHMGLFLPQKHQLSETQLNRAHGLAKIFFLKANSSDLTYFNPFGKVIHEHYLEETQQLVYFFFSADADAFDD